VLLMVRAWAGTRATAEVDAASGRLGRRASIAALVMLAAAQAAQAFVIDTRSINPGWVGEYTDLSRRDYVRFMELQGEQAAAIRTHWNAHGTVGRPPRIHVYAAGLIPYRLREANVVDGGLISNRHHVNVHSGHRGLLFSSDYVMTLAPKHQSLRHQLGRPPQAMELVDERQLFFDGRMETFRIFFDSSPIWYELPLWIDGKPIAPVPPPFGSDRP